MYCNICIGVLYLQIFNVQNMDWYENLPDSCPPSDAMEPSGESYYRIINSTQPVNSDFLSYRALNPDKKVFVSECQAKAISLFTDVESCRVISKLPKFKGKNIYIGELVLTKSDGLIAHTPNKNSTNHYSWWRSEEFDIKTVRLVNE